MTTTQKCENPARKRQEALQHHNVQTQRRDQRHPANASTRSAVI